MFYRWRNWDLKSSPRITILSPGTGEFVRNAGSQGPSLLQTLRNKLCILTGTLSDSWASTVCKTTFKVTKLIRRVPESWFLIPRILSSMQSILEYFLVFIYIYIFFFWWGRKFLASYYSVTQLCLALCDPMEYRPSDFSVHGIFQARILEWVAISFSRDSS